MTATRPRRPRRRPERMLTALLLTGTLLTACTPATPTHTSPTGTTSTKDHEMTPEQAQDASLATIAKVVAFLGGPDGWSAPTKNPPETCQVETPYDHVRYDDGQAIKPGIADLDERRALGERVRKYLESLGMETGYIAKDDPLLTTVVGRGDPVDSIGVDIDADHITVSATSLCVPGDLNEVMDEYLATTPPQTPNYVVVTDPPATPAP